jgi:hypothetical protein
VSSRYLTTPQQGYGTAHQALRKRLAPAVAAGMFECARCGKPIRPGEAWDLGHDDVDRARYIGPEHSRCNRATTTHRVRRVPRGW